MVQCMQCMRRFGRFSRVLPPGLHFLIPVVDRVAYVHSLKEEALAISNQSAITRDNVSSSSFKCQKLFKIQKCFKNMVYFLFISRFRASSTPGPAAPRARGRREPSARRLNAQQTQKRLSKFENKYIFEKKEKKGINLTFISPFFAKEKSAWPLAVGVYAQVTLQIDGVLYVQVKDPYRVGFWVVLSHFSPFKLFF